MQECWNPDPNKRPTSCYISKIFYKEIIPNYNDEIVIVETPGIGPIIKNISDKSKPLSNAISTSGSSSEQGNWLIYKIEIIFLKY